MRHARLRHFVAPLLGLLAAPLVAAGCGESRLQPNDHPPAMVLIEARDVAVADRYDVLIVVDDSASMAERQLDVAHAVGQVVRRMVEPGCVDASGVLVEPLAKSWEQGCPPGSSREARPVRDMHVGVITTSLDSPGFDGCVDDGGERAGEHGDASHLRTATADGSSIPTWNNRGFIVWDRDGVRACEPAVGGPCPVATTPDDLAAQVEAIVGGVGAAGCGNASPLEAAWRFLGDPAPHQSWADGAPVGVDDALLAQRAAFLGADAKPGRLVVVVVSDGDDASFRADVVGAYFADPESPMPRARTECVADPASPCCDSCVAPAPDGCFGDGGCEAPGCLDPESCPGNFHPPGSAEHDPTQRCVDAKRRFGIDGCYPARRWVNAFTAAWIADDRLDLGTVEGQGRLNPLASLSPRIVSVLDVPWQSIARRSADGEPDLASGLDPDGIARGGYMSASELEASQAWETVLAVPEAPRRILEVARGLGEAASLASITPPTFTSDAASARGLDVGFDAVALAAIGLADVTDDELCWFPGGDPAGEVPCRIVEAWDSDGDGDGATTDACTCPAPGRVDVDEVQEGLADTIRDLLADPLERGSQLLRPEPGFDCLCAIPQLEAADGGARSPLDACIEGTATPFGVSGWCYGVQDASAAVSCHPHGVVRFVGAAAPRSGSRLFITCGTDPG